MNIKTLFLIIKMVAKYKNRNFNKNLYALRGSATVHNIKLLCEVINNFNKYNEKSIDQNRNEGKQFYVMHKYFKNILYEYMNKNSNSFLDSNYSNWSKSNFK